MNRLGTPHFSIFYSWSGIGDVEKWMNWWAMRVSCLKNYYKGESPLTRIISLPVCRELAGKKLGFCPMWIHSAPSVVLVVHGWCPPCCFSLSCNWDGGLTLFLPFSGKYLRWDALSKTGRHYKIAVRFGGQNEISRFLYFSFAECDLVCCAKCRFRAVHHNV
jgi:hypothetical protein